MPPVWYVAGVVPVERARKLTPAQAELPRASGRYIAPERVEGETAAPRG